MTSKFNDDIEGLLRVASGRYNRSATGQKRTLQLLSDVSSTIYEKNPTMNPFNLAIPFGLIGPVLAVSAFAYLWRGSVQRFWWFIGIGGAASYVLMAVCLTLALSDVGMTGNLPGTPRPTLDPLAVRYGLFMLAWLIGSAVTLFITRHLLAKI
jgi:hypothetical protein